MGQKTSAGDVSRFAVYCGAGVYVSSASKITIDSDGAINAGVEVGRVPVEMQRGAAVQTCKTARACGVGSWVVAMRGVSA